MSILRTVVMHTRKSVEPVGLLVSSQIMRLCRIDPHGLPNAHEGLEAAVHNEVAR
jgi:hypothetical protein